jgi:hypothetical protein
VTDWSKDVVREQPVDARALGALTPTRLVALAHKGNQVCLYRLPLLPAFRRRTGFSRSEVWKEAHLC